MEFKLYAIERRGLIILSPLCIYSVSWTRCRRSCDSVCAVPAANTPPSRPTRLRRPRQRRRRQHRSARSGRRCRHRRRVGPRPVTTSTPSSSSTTSHSASQRQHPSDRQLCRPSNDCLGNLFVLPRATRSCCVLFTDADEPARRVASRPSSCSAAQYRPLCGPGRAIGRLCVCVSARAIIF